jgi:D-glycero-D-manno-heptose 1,7-bisphosphate phosphatase
MGSGGEHRAGASVINHSIRLEETPVTIITHYGETNRLSHFRAGREQRGEDRRRKQQGALRPALFLDRDGVVNEQLGVIGHPGDLRFRGGVFGFARLARTLGYALVIVTNQSGVARGLVSLAAMEAVNAAVRDRFALEGAPLDGLYVCPHHPDAAEPSLRRACACRKPAPGLITAAAADLRLDLSRSALIGHSACDIEAARRAGLPLAILLDGADMRAPYNAARCATFAEAASLLCLFAKREAAVA